VALLVDGILDIGDAAGEVAGVVEVEIVHRSGETVTVYMQTVVREDIDTVEEAFGIGAARYALDVVGAEHLLEDGAIGVLEVGVLKCDAGVVVHIVCCFCYNTNIQKNLNLIVKNKNFFEF